MDLHMEESLTWHLMCYMPWCRKLKHITYHRKCEVTVWCICRCVGGFSSGVCNLYLVLENLKENQCSVSVSVSVSVTINILLLNVFILVLIRIIVTCLGEHCLFWTKQNQAATKKSSFIPKSGGTICLCCCHTPGFQNIRRERNVFCNR